MRWPNRNVLIYFFLTLSLLIGSESPAQSVLTISSPAFENGGTIPTKYTCSGENVSPPLGWKGTPETAKSLVLIVSDPDAPNGTFIHWVVYNLPARLNQLAEDIDAKPPVIPGGGEQGKNHTGKYGYFGPCPPPGSTHHYHFRLIALDESLKLQAGATADELEAAMKGHVAGEGELIGTFGR
jgi:Raf kinase inhibitor-like YbhB/YbcL family protein